MQQPSASPWRQTQHATAVERLANATQALLPTERRSLESCCSACEGTGGALKNGEHVGISKSYINMLQDLSGRRVRHSNAEKKLAEWAAEARERELEKIALKHQKEQERAAALEKRAQVCYLPLLSCSTCLREV